MAINAPRAVFVVRETDYELLIARHATREQARLVTSRMNGGCVIFADGIEQDFLAFGWGETVTIDAAERTLALVVG